MKLLFNSGLVTPLFFPRFRLLDSIQRHGWRIIASGYDPNGKELCDKYGIGYHEILFDRVGTNPLKDYKAFKTYCKIIREENIDVVHSYTTKPNIYGSIAAKRAGVTKIYPTVNGLGYSFTEYADRGIKSRVVRVVVSKLYKKAFSCATKVFFQNPDDADLMVKEGLVSRDKCIIIPGSGVELQQFPYSDVRVTPMTFLIATRLLVSKGVRTYCEAAKIVKNQYPDTEFLIAGGFDHSPDRIKEKELQLYIESGVVKYLGYVDDMPKTLSECSVFVLPSFYREGIPHAILEALSTGRAVITCNTPGCKETIKYVEPDGKGKNGFLIKPKNSELLAEKMIWMIQNPIEVRKMGRESRKYAEERFDVEKVNQVILETMGII